VLTSTSPVPWNLDTLAAARGTHVEVRACNEQNAEVTVLVNRARARVVHLGKRDVVAVRNGMPDVSLNGLAQAEPG
jgi:hypothetical protein